MMKRIEYIDAMRGLAILLVVIGHMLLFSFHNSQCIYFTVLNAQMEIPLFLMISGFFMNKPLESWTGEKIFGVIKNKFIPMVVAPIALMLLYDYISDYDIKPSFFDSWKNGYWFTISLFEFILVYFCLIGISKLFRLKDVWSDVFVVVASIVIMYVGVLFIRYEKQYSFIGLLNLVHFTKFIYFVFGVMCAKYLEKLCKLFDNKYLLGGGIVAYFLLCAYSYKDGGMRYFGSSTFYFMLLTLLGLLIIFAAFRKYDALSTSSTVGRCLQYIGK